MNGETRAVYSVTPLGSSSGVTLLTLVFLSDFSTSAPQCQSHSPE
jgi:hypothetical protein